MKKAKTFDCVEMKHKGAQELQKKIANMTLEEELEFWRKGTEALREKQRRLREERHTK